jgi:hypothetical protein
MNPFCKDSWSHLSISIDGKFFDATGKGVREHTTESFLKQYRIVETHETDIEMTMEEFYRFFNKYRGREYDSLQILGLALKMLDIIKFNKYGSDFDKMICNELFIALLVFKFDFKFKDSDDYGLIDTWELAKEY